MTSQLRRDALATFFPAIGSLDIDAAMERFLSEGGQSILLGETRQEYLDRRMSRERCANETADAFRACTDKAKGLAKSVLVGIDQEIGGIERLHALAPSLPTRKQLESVSTAEVENAAAASARAAKLLGVNLFLAPILDLTSLNNPWLERRTIAASPERVAEIGAAFIRGVQGAGVSATAKHFPGYTTLPLDPAISDIVYQGTMEDIAINLRPFKAAIDAGVGVVMAGPAAVQAIDAVNAASTSPAIVSMLKKDLAFRGLVMSDDLDSVATLRGRSLETTAIEALKAGFDMLLIAHGPHIFALADAIVAAVESGNLPAERVSHAAGKVRSLALDFS